MAQALQVEQGSCADPGNFVRRGGGGGGGGGRGQKNSLNLFYRVDPMVLLQRGGGGPASSRGWGLSKENPYDL